MANRAHGKRSPRYAITIAADHLEDIRVADLHTDQVIRVKDVYLARDRKGTAAFIEVSLPGI